MVSIKLNPGGGGSCFHFIYWGLGKNINLDNIYSMMTLKKTNFSYLALKTSKKRGGLLLMMMFVSNGL
jgi:hypothetical protein